MTPSHATAPAPRPSGRPWLDERSTGAEDAAIAPPPRYCPAGLLAGFALLMAGHGRCVHAAMMLGDSDYAHWQLAWARGSQDPELMAVADRLQGYFDEAAPA